MAKGMLGIIHRSNHRTSWCIKANSKQFQLIHCIYLKKILLGNESGLGSLLALGHMCKLAKCWRRYAHLKLHCPATDWGSCIKFLEVLQQQVAGLSNNVQLCSIHLNAILDFFILFYLNLHSVVYLIYFGFV